MPTLRIKLAAMALGLSLGVSAAAHATTVFSDNFDGENGGASATNYTGFANWTSTGGGGVDLVKNGDFGGLQCEGGAGSCVDLAGSPGPGQITSTASFAFVTGQQITLSFDVSGNQRDPSALDDLYGGFTFNTSTTLLNYTTGGAFVPFNYGTLNGGGFTTGGNIVPGNAPYQTYTLSWTAGSSGTMQVIVGSFTPTNIGPMLDNVRLDISGRGVPEPATWALMIGGFFGAGSALRRRKLAAA